MGGKGRESDIAGREGERKEVRIRCGKLKGRLRKGREERGEDRKGEGEGERRRESTRRAGARLRFFPSLP